MGTVPASQATATRQLRGRAGRLRRRIRPSPASLLTGADTPVGGYALLMSLRSAPDCPIPALPSRDTPSIRQTAA
jgi:hypothetical protein